MCFEVGILHFNASTIFAIIYGMVNKTSPDRWIENR